MYFSSDSWGKFMPVHMHSDLMGMDEDELSSILKRLNINLHLHFENEKDKEINVKYMKDLLEGLRKMPVLNPKTGEQDHVDINLVEKIIVDPEYLKDMKTNKEIKLDIKLAGEKSSNSVHLSVLNENQGIQETESISLQTFEEMLFEAIHENKDQKLEEVKSFKEIVSILINRAVDNSRENKNQLLAWFSHDYVLDNGIGIIRDMKTDQEIGTFESIKYAFDLHDSVCNIDGILLYGRSFSDLKEKDRFDFSFYSIKHKKIFTFLANKSSHISTLENKSTASIERFKFLSGHFYEDHQYYQMIVEAESEKDLIKDIKQVHPLYASQMERFRKSRLLILEKSKQKQKQKKLTSQFSDIEIDF